MALAILSLAALAAADDCVGLLQTSSVLRRRPYRQELVNQQDVSYTAKIRVGGQEVAAILDSGSFELVVFTKGCPGCGAAGLNGYEPQLSDSYKPGRLVQQLSYGSGDAFCADAFDSLDIGPIHLQRQPIWLVEKAQMQVLQSAPFQAILGLGPATAVKQQAQMDKSFLESLEAKLAAWHVQLPRLQRNIQSKKEADKMMADLDDSVPGNVNLRFLSICLPAKSNGVAVWNDVDPATRAFRRLAVVGKITWGLTLKNVRLVTPKGSMDIACQSGCSAIVDTGTSLLSAPQAALLRMAEVLKALQVNCLEPKSLPHLEFELGGQSLSLPPESYMGYVTGVMSAPWMKRFHQKPFLKVVECQLVMMDLGRMSGDLGPMWIMGMPFFRSFYTTFDYESPSIWVAQADEHCEPSESRRKASALLEVNQSGLRLPAWIS